MLNTVYIIKTEGKDLYKIGFTSASVSQRISELQTGCPYKLHYIYHAKVKDARAVESYLHNCFNKHRMSGEWFKFDTCNLMNCIGIIQGIESQLCLERVRESNTKGCKKEISTLEDRIIVNSTEVSQNWYKWLPEKDTVIRLLEKSNMSLSTFVRNVLKKTDAEYNRKAKSAIVQMLLDLERFDLIEKYQINPKDYPLS